MLGESRACRLDEGVAVRTYGHVPRRPTQIDFNDGRGHAVANTNRNPVQLEKLREAADRKHVHVDTLRRAIARGELTGYKFGARIMRVDPTEVDALFRTIPTAGGAG